MTARFSKATIEFLLKASRQKKPDWLERNRADYEKLVLEPLTSLAHSLKKELAPLAPGYNFPQKGIGRLKRPAHKVAEGGGLYRSWLTYSAARPRKSRFEHNPNLFFMIDAEDADDSVLIAGGLYMPSSRQMRAIRESIARDASAFERLFATKDFAKHFPGGFSDEKISKRPTRGYDPEHPRMHWLRLQAFFVWHRYSLKQFSSREFPGIVAADCRQILKLNRLLDQAIAGRMAAAERDHRDEEKASGLLDRLESLERFERTMDF